MRLLLLLVASAPAWAAFTFTPNPPPSPVAHDITHWQTRVIMGSSVATTARVVWDTFSHSCSSPCAAYPNTDNSGNSLNATVHTWFVGAYPATANSTGVFYRWCANDGSGEVCSAEITFTPPALPVPHPALATLPQVQVSTAAPVTPGTTYTIGTAPCTLGIADCWVNHAVCGDIIYIPAGQTVSEYTSGLGGNPTKLTAKTCSAGNWIQIRSNAADSALPPFGTGINPSNYAAYSASLATIENGAMNHYAYTLGALTNANCAPGAYRWYDSSYPSTNPAGWYMRQCVQDTAFAITAASQVTSGGLTTATITAPGHNIAIGDNVFTAGLVGVNLANGTGFVTNVVGSVITVNMGYKYIDLSNSYVSGGTIARHVWGGSTVAYTAVNPASLPGTCTTGAWGYNDGTAGGAAPLTDYDFANVIPSTASTGNVWRCSSTNKWSHWQVILQDPISPPYLLYALDLTGSSYVWLGPGLQFRDVIVPSEPLFLRDGAINSSVFTNFQGGKVGGVLIATSLTSSHVTIDRDAFTAPNYPNGMANGVLSLNGDSIGLTNNYIAGFGYWFGALDRGVHYDNYAAPCVIRSGGNGWLQANNYSSCDGESVHHDDAYAGLYFNQNLTTSRNIFFKDASHFYQTAANASAYPSGVYWPYRQNFECKQCQQHLLSGNQFVNNWRNTSAGSGIGFFPRSDSAISGGTPTLVSVSGSRLTWTGLPAINLVVNDWVACTIGGTDSLLQVATVSPTGGLAANAVTTVSSPAGATSCWPLNWPGSVSDVTIQSNTFTNLPNAINLQNFPNPKEAVVSPAQRLTIQNNLSYNIIDDGTRQDPNSWQGSGGGYWLYDVDRYAGDFNVSHNTGVQVGGAAGTFFGGFGTHNTADGVYVQNNIMSMASGCAGTCAANSPINGGGASGDALFAAMYINSSLANNLFQMAGGNPGGYAGSDGTWLSSVSQYNFYNPTADFHQQPAAPGISGGHLTTDGLDMGADIDALNVDQGQVLNVRVRSIAATTATVSFLAPDTFGCKVDWSTSPTFATFTRVANAGGQRIQDVSLTGLTTATLNYYRVSCAVQQPTGAFLTH